MKKIVQFHIYKGEKYYIAECIDLPVVTQGKTLDELIKNLREAIELHLDGEDISRFDIAPNPAFLANIELGPMHYAQT
jgi:predicted RNase H-like HicB family nuclease